MMLLRTTFRAVFKRRAQWHCRSFSQTVGGTADHVESFRRILGDTRVVVDDDDLQKFNCDWTNAYSGATEIALTPKSTEEVRVASTFSLEVICWCLILTPAFCVSISCPPPCYEKVSSVLRYCSEHNIAVVPQGWFVFLVWRRFQHDFICTYSMMTRHTSCSAFGLTGGNTGLVGGGIPIKDEVVLSLGVRGSGEASCVPKQLANCNGHNCGDTILNFNNRL